MQPQNNQDHAEQHERRDGLAKEGEGEQRHKDRHQGIGDRRVSQAEKEEKVIADHAE